MTDLGRRTLLSAAGLTALAALAGCASSEREPTNPTQRDSSDMATTPTPSGGSNVLLVYFSRAGENYWNGGRRDLEVGNTKVVAQMIADRIDCDVYEILAVDPYPEAYDPTVARNQREQHNDARPGIDGEIPDVSDYDTILLGNPVWNTRAPMIMRTFLDSTDALAGKTIHPFVTYALGEGSVFDDYAAFCPNATVEDGFAVRGEEARDAAPEVETWLRASGLL